MKKHYLGLILVGSLTFTLACQPKSEESTATETQEQTAEEAPESRPSPLVTKEGQVAGKTKKYQKFAFDKAIFFLNRIETIF